jgi:TolA-binding protein
MERPSDRCCRRVATLLALLCGLAARAQQAPPDAREIETELRYVRGLQALGLPQFADLVIADLEARHPGTKARLAAIKIENLLLQGNFDEVRRIIAARPDQDSAEVWAMKLAMADACYAREMYAETKGIYESFFKRFESPPAELRELYSESAYKYAQMLLNLKELRPALELYQRVLKVKQEEHIERQCLAEMADIHIRLAMESADAKEREAALKEAEKIADKLLWKQDIWFGKAIVIKAHVAMLRGRPEAAKKLVDDYLGTLNTIHEALAQQEAETGEPLTRVSPMPECRYLLGVMLQEEAERLMKNPGFDKEAVLSLLVGTRDPAGGGRQGNGAYQHFINVYLRYPESAWAAEAGERAEQVRLIVSEVFGGQITAAVTPEQTAKVRAIQFRDARRLFAQGQLDNARDRLLRLVNLFPEAPETVAALGDLARIYIQTLLDAPENELHADMVTGHLAERFSAFAETRLAAGDELIRLAEYWLETTGRADKRAAVYNLYFTHFPDHPLAANMLASFGERCYQEKDYAGALDYFRRVAESYAGTQRAMDALSRIAAIYEETGDHTNHLAAIEQYVERLAARPDPGQELMNARFRQAQAMKNLALSLLRSSTNEADRAAANQWLARAAKAYNDLAETLQRPGHPYQANEEEARRNSELLEAALYNAAFCLSQLTEPAANVPAIRRRAAEFYAQLVERFPKSKYAPAALIQIGSIWTVLRDAAQAEAALSRLLKEYPDSPEARSALPLIADSLMKLGMREEAVARYRQMFAESGGKYSDSDLLRAARALIEAKEHDLARQGLERLLARSRDVAVVAPARLAQAELLLAREEYGEAIKVLESFIKDYPNLALVVDASLLLSKAASKAGEMERDELRRKLLFNTAVEAMRLVRQRRTNQLDMAVADIEVGRILARKARAESRFGLTEKAARSRGEALVAYQSFIDLTNPANPALAPLLETAYAECVPLLLEHGQWRLALENCDNYLAAFPRGRYLGEMRAWRNRALIELGEAAPAEGRTEDAAAPPAEEEREEAAGTVVPPAAAPPPAAETPP